VVQNFSKDLRIGFISFELSSLEKGCLRFERFVKEMNPILKALLKHLFQWLFSQLAIKKSLP